MNEQQTKLLQDTDDARYYLATYFSSSIGRHDFKDYILNKLAGDYACVFAAKLADLEEKLHNKREALEYRSYRADEDIRLINSALGLADATFDNCVDAIKELKAAPSPRLRIAAKALLDDVKSRHPGEDLYCKFMIELDEAVQQTSKINIIQKTERSADPVIAALQRCRECWEDGEGTDIGKDKLKALETFGYVRMLGKQWEITDEGMALIGL